MASRSSADDLDGLTRLSALSRSWTCFAWYADEPGDAPLEHPLRQGQVVAAGDLQAVDDQGRRVGRGVFAEAREPAPAAVGELHVGQALKPARAILATSACVEDRVVLVALPLLRPLAGVAQLLGVEVGVLRVDRLQVERPGRSGPSGR